MTIKQDSIKELDLIIGMAAADNATVHGNTPIEEAYETLKSLISEHTQMEKDLKEITKLMNHLIKNDMLYSQLVTRTVNEVLEIASKCGDGSNE